MDPELLVSTKGKCIVGDSWKFDLTKVKFSNMGGGEGAGLRDSVYF